MQCRLSAIRRGFLELRAVNQGKYEEKKREENPKKVGGEPLLNTLWEVLGGGSCTSANFPALAEIALAHGREVREVLPAGRQWQVTGCGRQETGKVPETG